VNAATPPVTNWRLVMCMRPLRGWRLLAAWG
jgi:hypothetical protein